MELKDNIEFLKTLAEKLKQEVSAEDEEVKAYLQIGRMRMTNLETKRERLHHLESAVNNLSSLLDETPDHVPTTEDPWS
jgi:Tfp pilus assembly protein PilO